MPLPTSNERSSGHCNSSGGIEFLCIYSIRFDTDTRDDAADGKRVQTINIWLKDFVIITNIKLQAGISNACSCAESPYPSIQNTAWLLYSRNR